MTTSFTAQYLSEAKDIIEQLDVEAIEKLTQEIGKLKKDGGRLFFLGIGGSAGNCGHAVNDFRKLLGIEAYAPTDNVSELTARTNDEGFETVFVEWLKLSKLSKNDALFILSVGGGNEGAKVSVNIVESIKLAKQTNSKIFGIVGKADGYAASHGDNIIVIPQVEPSRVTPHSEAFQAVVWHLIVSHPTLSPNATKW